MKKNNKGFSLIEIMVVVVIIGILVAVAIPSYQTYALRGQLVPATTTLTTVRAQMEQYYQDNRTYNASGSYTPPCSSIAANGTFTFACAIAADPATTYKITATGSGATAGFVYTIDQANNQVTVSSKSGWGTANSPCWIVAKGQKC